VTSAARSTDLPAAPAGESVPVGGWRRVLAGSWRLLAKELAAFGLVGVAALGVDLGLYNLLAGHGWLKAKAVSTLVATVISYAGNRHWSFAHRARTGLARESAWFAAINVAVLAVSELLLAAAAYPLGWRTDHAAMNAVNLLTIGLGTLVRFWAYKRHVFPPADVPASADRS